MAKTSDQIEIVARRKKGTKTEEEKKKKKKKNQSLSQSSNKGNNNTTTTTKKRKKKSDKNESQNKDEYEGIVVPDSQDENGDEFVEDSYEDHANKEEKSNGVANQRSKKAKNGKDKTDLVTMTTTKKKKNIKNKEEEESESGCGSGSTTGNCFPMYRMNRMIRSEDPDIRISQESVFLINKASEKFLELFCKEAYACAFLDHKNHVSYKHLSTVVSKRKRFDFLSDFVPEKVKAEDAIAEVPVAET